MEELIARITSALGVEASVAAAAVSHVLEFLRKEFPEGPVAELIDKLHADMTINETTVATGEAPPPSGLGGLMSAAGGVMGLAAKLNSLGLDMSQMQKLAKEVFGHAEQLIGREKVQAIAEAIPALRPFL